MAFTEDYTNFFETDDFAVTATIGGSSVSVIFDHEYVELNEIVGEFPVIRCATSDIGAAAYDTAVVVNGTNYKIKIRKDDGTGVSEIVLEEQ